MQGAFTYQDECALRSSISSTMPRYGDIPSSTFLNLAFGLEKDKYALELFLANATDEDAPLGVTSECSPGVCGVPDLRRAGPAAHDRHPLQAGLLTAGRGL